MSFRSALVLFLALLLHATTVSVAAQTLTSIYSFPGSGGGAYPNGGLVLDAQGNVYGTTSAGGTQNGIVFKISPSGVPTTLLTFRPDSGRNPEAGLVVDASGNFYGTTAYGGAHQNGGTVFKLSASGVETVLHSFANNSRKRRQPPEAFYPWSPLVFDALGNLYGTASSGGDYDCVPPHGCGAVLQLSPSGTETLLHKFTGGSDGAFPYSSLIFDKAGNLYGNTTGGGPAGCGVVFKLTPAGVETVLYAFTCGADGANPYDGLILDKKGNLYGTALQGGISNEQCTGSCGVVFRVSPSGVETVLYSFTGGGDGMFPVGSLVADNKGNLYGATANGAEFGCGTLFRIKPSRAFKVLHTFTCGADGGSPTGSLTLDNHGTLYGTTTNGGDIGWGTVFKLTP